MSMYKFDFKNADEIKNKSAELGAPIGFSENYGVFSQKVYVEPGLTLKNALAVHPMEAFDGTAAGAPGELTIRRYGRFAESGAGLIWFEAVAVQDDARTSPRQLMLTKNNADDYKRLVEMIKKSAGSDVKIICQLTHSGRYSKPRALIASRNSILDPRLELDPSYPCVSDDYLKRAEDAFEDVAVMSRDAGFDGVDVKACHKYLIAELLGAFGRENSEYGGSYENRTRMFKNVIKRVKDRLGSSYPVASRFSLSDVIPYPDGFGVPANSDDPHAVDLTEPLRLIGEINGLGVNLLNITMGVPYYNSHINRPFDEGSYLPPFHPLASLGNFIRHIGTAQKAYPDMTFVGTGYSYLREFTIGAAAYAIENKLAKVIGLGRGAFAYKGFAADMLDGFMDPKKCCIACSKCTQIMRAGGATGCPIRDSEAYMPIYRQYCEM